MNPRWSDNNNNKKMIDQTRRNTKMDNNVKVVDNLMSNKNII